MTDIIKMNYELMDQTIRTCEMCAQRLEEIDQIIKAIAQAMQDGALLGQGGEAYVEALQGSLSPAILKLQDKFVELQQDLQMAVADMKSADVETRGKF